jgi:hypothetical protein
MRRILILTIVLTVGLLIFSTSLVSAKTIALWLCDEGKGETLKDNSDNGHDGVFEGKVAWAEGMYGKALEFHGSPDNVFVEGSEDLTGSGAMTVELWLKAPKQAAYHIPIAKGLKGVGHWEMYLLAGQGFLSAYIPDLGDFTGTNWVSDDKWHHCAIIWDGSAVRLYTDGKMVNEWAGLKGKKIVADDQGLRIGALFGKELWHTGLIDEIRISDTALDVNELGFDGSLAIKEAVDQRGKLAVSWGVLKTQY